ncbi:hypothetical protein DFH09DRAFT_1279562 [Mycena vulgaris]|nr:hypothetical protein DFH09DRAFT_1279562 [Mycena vulgaris]
MVEFYPKSKLDVVAALEVCLFKLLLLGLEDTLAKADSLATFLGIDRALWKFMLRSTSLSIDRIAFDSRLVSSLAFHRADHPLHNFGLVSDTIALPQPPLYQAGWWAWSHPLPGDATIGPSIIYPNEVEEFKAKHERRTEVQISPRFRIQNTPPTGSDLSDATFRTDAGSTVQDLEVQRIKRPFLCLFLFQLSAQQSSGLGSQRPVSIYVIGHDIRIVNINIKINIKYLAHLKPRIYYWEPAEMAGDPSNFLTTGGMRSELPPRRLPYRLDSFASSTTQAGDWTDTSGKEPEARIPYPRPLSSSAPARPITTIRHCRKRAPDEDEDAVRPRLPQRRGWRGRGDDVTPSAGASACGNEDRPTRVLGGRTIAQDGRWWWADRALTTLKGQKEAGVRRHLPVGRARRILRRNARWRVGGKCGNEVTEALIASPLPPRDGHTASAPCISSKTTRSASRADDDAHCEWGEPWRTWVEGYGGVSGALGLFLGGGRDSHCGSAAKISTRARDHGVLVRMVGGLRVAVLVARAAPTALYSSGAVIPRAVRLTPPAIGHRGRRSARPGVACAPVPRMTAPLLFSLLSALEITLLTGGMGLRAAEGYSPSSGHYGRRPPPRRGVSSYIAADLSLSLAASKNLSFGHGNPRVGRAISLALLRARICLMEEPRAGLHTAHRYCRGVPASPPLYIGDGLILVAVAWDVLLRLSIVLLSSCRQWADRRRVGHTKQKSVTHKSSSRGEQIRRKKNQSTPP